jgi:phosphomannomutase
MSVNKTNHKFDPTILREYDIRGIIDKTLTAADARAIGQAFATVTRRKGGSKVAVGYDGRLSSPMLADAVVAGLNAADALFCLLPPGRGRRHSDHRLAQSAGL